MIQLRCSSWDFYNYNMQGPFTSAYAGERSHFHVTVDINKPILFTFRSDIEGIEEVSTSLRLLYVHPVAESFTRRTTP